MKFHQNPSSGSRAVPRGETGRRTDMTELIVAFQDFANAPKNQKVNSSSEFFYQSLYEEVSRSTV